MKCPVCPTILRMGNDGLVKCSRFHRFRLTVDDSGKRVLTVAVEPKDSQGTKVGDTFPVVDDDETFS